MDHVRWNGKRPWALTVLRRLQLYKYNIITIIFLLMSNKLTQLRGQRGHGTGRKFMCAGLLQQYLYGHQHNKRPLIRHRTMNGAKNKRPPSCLHAVEFCDNPGGKTGGGAEDVLFVVRYLAQALLSWLYTVTPWSQYPMLVSFISHLSSTASTHPGSIVVLAHRTGHAHWSRTRVFSCLVLPGSAGGARFFDTRSRFALLLLFLLFFDDQSSNSEWKTRKQLSCKV